MEDNPFNINNDYSSFRDNHNAALNEFLSIENYKSQEEGLQKIIDIAYYLQYISNENDLKIVIDELKKSNSLFNLDTIERQFIETIKANNYNTLQGTRLKAVVYSELLKHNAYKLAYANLFPEGFGEFEFLVYKDMVTTTIRSFEQKINSKNTEVKKPNLKKIYDYCDLGVLIVVTKEITKKGDYFYYDSKKFTKPEALEDYLHENKKCTTKSIRQYLNPSFLYEPNDKRNELNKSLFKPSRVKKILEYCRLRDIEYSASLEQSNVD